MFANIIISSTGGAGVLKNIHILGAGGADTQKHKYIFGAGGIGMLINLTFSGPNAALCYIYVFFNKIKQKE